MIRPNLVDDASTLDDFVLDGELQPARGVSGRVLDMADPAAPVVLWQGFTEGVGASAGCTPELTLSTEGAYRVMAWTEGRVAGHNIDVHRSPVASTAYAWVDPSFQPTGPLAPAQVLVEVGTKRPWQSYLVASHALWREDGGQSALNLTVYVDECPYLAEGGTCFDRATGAVYVGGEGQVGEPGALSLVYRKYRVAHEIGHFVAWTAIGSPALVAHAYDADPGSCVTSPTASHEAVSKEYQSAAIWEGFAHAYAAIAFNQAAGGDCGFVYYKQVDWDGSRFVEGPELTAVDDGVSCVNAPLPGSPSHDHVGAACDGSLINRGVEWDWLRLLWHNHANLGIPFSEQLQVLADAEPATWWDGPIAPELPYSTVNFPAYRMAEAAAARGIATWAADSAWHGAHR